VRVAVGKSVGVAVSVGVRVGVRVGRGVRLGGSVACVGVSLGVGVAVGVSVGSGVTGVAVGVALGTCAPFVPGARVISLISCGGGGGVVVLAHALRSKVIARTGKYLATDRSCTVSKRVTRFINLSGFYDRNQFDNALAFSYHQFSRARQALK
jgi:hypothetical protein